MDFTLTGTQRELTAAARRYLGERYPLSRIAELSDAARHDRLAWPELDRQGWLDPDLGIVELTLLAEEGGRALHPVPWWATVGLALPAYQAGAAELPGPATLADGSTTCRAQKESGAWRLDGRVARVVDAEGAAEIVVAAAAGSGVALFGVRPGGPGVALTGRDGIDPLRRSADLDVARAPARLLVGPAAAAAVLASTERRAAALLAGEAVGVADRALDLAVAHAKTRVQFDRPIGSYQAVAHQLANSYAELELARSLAYRAACALADRARPDQTRPDQTRPDQGHQAEPAGRPDGVVEALACAAHACAGAAIEVCEVAIQVCGGMGVTWEFPLHRWYRRALWLRAFHAGRPDPLATIADGLFGAAPG